MSEKENEGSLLVLLSRIESELKKLNANIKSLVDAQEKRTAFGRYPRGERKMSRGGERRGGYGRPRRMYRATCSDCGKETEVPFKPTGDRPVYCSDCYKKHRR